MIELTSSIVSSTFSTCIVYPGERIKIEMHLDKDKELKDTKDAIKKIYHRYGFKGFYQGLSS